MIQVSLKIMDTINRINREMALGTPCSDKATFKELLACLNSLMSMSVLVTWDIVGDK